MPNFSGVWNLKEQIQAIAAGRWQLPPPKFELYTWGRNIFGALGDNTTVNKPSPVKIGALTNWAQAAAGQLFTAAIKTDGTLWTWGYKSSGALGQGALVNQSSPVQVGALTNWDKISTKNYHCGAIKTDGTLWSWGRNNVGQLGDGTTDNKSSPIQVGALTTWSQISAGENFSAAVKTDNTLWIWGTNNTGQLGIGTGYGTNESSPVQVGALTTWAQVSLSNQQHSLAIKTDGTLWGWGENGFGEVGDGTATDRSSPVQVGVLTNWSQVAAGGFNNVAITES